MIPQNPQHHIVHLPLVPSKELPECLLIPSLTPCYQKILIHVNVRPF